MGKPSTWSVVSILIRPETNILLTDDSGNVETMHKKPSPFYRPPAPAPNAAPAHESHYLSQKKRNPGEIGTYCNTERTVTQFADSFHASFIRARDNSPDRASSMSVNSSNSSFRKKWPGAEPTAAQRRPWDVRLITANRRKHMDLPLIIAILALLAWTLLPQLDRYADSEATAESKRSYLSRLARWVNN
jgi:hypothetical protein